MAAHRKRGPPRQLHPPEALGPQSCAGLCRLHQGALRALPGHVPGAQTAKDARPRGPAVAHTAAAEAKGSAAVPAHALARLQRTPRRHTFDVGAPCWPVAAVCQ